LQKAEATLRKQNAELIQAVEALRFEITERELTEVELRKAHDKLKQMQQNLVHSEKLAALGQFSSSIAHEVKNPLAIILSGLEFLEMKLNSDNTDVSIAIGKIKEATLRADRVLKNILKFSKPSDLQIEKVMSEDLVKDALSFFEYKAPLRNINIKTQFAERPIYVEVDKLQIQQVLFNLLMNSVEAMPKGGEIQIKIYNSVFDKDESFCVIEIMDTGEGIPESDLPSIFESFFTTKGNGDGTGLGLSISKMIIDDHGGDLIIDSEFGKGTCVKVILPVT
jgi:two-component system NtrC family sensor kinase